MFLLLLLLVTPLQAKPKTFAKPDATFVRQRSTYIIIVPSESVRWCLGKPSPHRFTVNGTFFDKRTGRLLGKVVADGKQVSPPVGGKPPRPEIDLPHLTIGGGVTLVLNGKVDIRLRQEKFRRDVGQSRRMAAMGVNQRGDKCVLLVTTNRSIRQVAKLMLGYGCYKAMRLDGGSSTFLSVNNRTVVSGRRHNCIYIVPNGKSEHCIDTFLKLM